MNTSTDAQPADESADLTMGAIAELVRQFDESQWSTLELDLHGMHLVLGRHGRPEGSPEAVPVPAPAPAPVALVEAAPVTPPAATEAPVAAPPSAQAAPAPTPGRAEPAPGRHRTQVTAPVVGTFWVAPGPGEPPFVGVGDEVAAGQQLAIVEVMKLMSQVTAPVAGTIVEICVADAELVEFEQVLFVIESDDD